MRLLRGLVTIMTLAAAPLGAMTAPAMAQTTPAARQAPATPVSGWQSLDLAGLNVRVAGYRGAVAGSLEIPAGWARVGRGPADEFYFDGPDAQGRHDLFLVLRMERHRPGQTLEDAAKLISREISRRGYQFKVLGHDYTTIADRAAYIVSLQYSEAARGFPERNDFAIIDAGDLFYSVQFGAPLNRYDEVSGIFSHAIDTLAVAR